MLKVLRNKDLQWAFTFAIKLNLNDMRKSTIWLGALAFGLLSLQQSLAQTTLTVRVATADDDQEEFLPGGTKQAGLLDAGSSDLEFGSEAANNADPQLVGMRFQNITIPQGAYITEAYIQLAVDATGKNSNPSNLVIFAEDVDSAVTYNPAENFNISKRQKSKDSVLFSFGPWPLVGEAGNNQRTGNIAKLIQGLISRSGWKSGNAVAFMVKGSGTREAESYDGDAPKAPLLVVKYILPSALTVRVSAADDDQEEFLPGGTKQAGLLDAGSSDLELGSEAANNADPQLVGVRFQNVALPKGAIVTRAYIQFAVDATGKNSNPSDLVAYAEDEDSAVTYNPAENFNISKRKKSTDSVTFSFGPWPLVGEAGANQRTGNIATLVQAIVGRSGWKSGNPMAFMIKGKGTREAESFDGDAPKAPLLVVEYVAPVQVSTRISQADDDQEEFLAPSSKVGTLDAGSSDLELGSETANNGDPQLVGMRFANVAIPQGAKIMKAYVQFAVDATGKNSDPSNLVLYGENVDSASTYNPAENFNISKRARTSDSVQFSFGPWPLVGEAGENQRTADIAKVIQAIVNRPGWKAGNALAVMIKGVGTREAESFDGDAPKAPLLVVEYLGTGSVVIKPTPNPTTAFPILSGSKWSYQDEGKDLGSNWRQPTYNGDSTWKSGAAPLGYGDPMNTFVSFGSNASNKHTTTYFKKRFTVSNLASLPDTLDLSLMCDDGAVVYLNGAEVARQNIPAGPISFNTFASTAVGGGDETAFTIYKVAKSNLQAGENFLAVEVHQSDANSSDLGFDLELTERIVASNPVAMGCVDGSDHIACFTSLLPSNQGQTMVIPSSHAFQVIAQEGDSYVGNVGKVGGSNDFTGFVPENMVNSRKGVLSVNHETSPGGVSMFDLHFDNNLGHWVVSNSQAVDFSGVVKTESNCSGGITPWETVITCEESMSAGDVNGDGYQDIGWNVEIDPKTKRVKEYGNGKQEKLWAMGRISHENVVVAQDSVTAYYGEDDGSGNLFKFVANQKTNLSAGTLYVLKLNSPLSAGEPTTMLGEWVVVPNTTVSERNNTKATAAALGGTFFNGIEDVEINPVNGMIYFTAKGHNRTYRFKDNGSTVGDFITFVGGKSYQINHGASVAMEAWGSGNDNLTFDDKGNLWVLQDGSRNHIWLVRPDHTQTNPKVELFMKTPVGSEPTGMTFTPDFKFMFLSIQSPSSSNNATLKDAAGKDVAFNRSSTVVIARKEMFSIVTGLENDAINTSAFDFNVYPNPSHGEASVLFRINTPTRVKIGVFNLEGRELMKLADNFMSKGEHVMPINSLLAGTYFIKIESNEKSETRKLIVH
jgi:secreted PhoX family phosphatase